LNDELRVKNHQRLITNSRELSLSFMMDHFKFKFQGEQKKQIGVARKEPISYTDTDRSPRNFVERPLSPRLWTDFSTSGVMYERSHRGSGSAA
jgi:hypothetical protein